MSIEFVDGQNSEFDNLLSGLLGSLLGDRRMVTAYTGEPDSERYTAIHDLFKDHQRRLDEGREYTENGMLTPRLMIRDHDDMHLLMTALDKYMTEVDQEWYNAATAYAVGNTSETLEALTLRSREITEAAKLRHALEREHTAWAVRMESPIPDDDNES